MFRSTSCIYAVVNIAVPCHLGNCSCVTLPPASMQSQHHVIASMDGGTYDLSGTKIMTAHPEHRRSLPSMAPRHTAHPEHKKSLLNNE